MKEGGMDGKNQVFISKGKKGRPADMPILSIRRSCTSSGTPNESMSPPAEKSLVQ